MDRKFRSKVDGWFYIIVATFTVIPVIWLILWMENGGSYLFAAVIFLISDAGLIYPIFLDTVYTFEPNGLRIKAGFVTNIQIAYQDITGFFETVESGPSPALSGDRIRIDFRTEAGEAGRILVSPAQKAAFMEMLNKKTAPYKDSERDM
ncbi:MAG: PH domain-containing protein [Oscillospiraceae bacterium]